MDGMTINLDVIPQIPESPGRGSPNNDDLPEECRNLLAALSEKLNSLSHEIGSEGCHGDNIRSISETLSLLRSLLETRAIRIPSSCKGELRDGKGIRYIGVRNCEIERWFSIK
jgi:hypothetical protein